MKNLLKISFLFLLFLSACGEEEPQKLELFSPEAFAFSLEGGWEINASVQVKGLTQKEENSEYIIDLDYQVDLKLPNGDVVTKADADQIVDRIDETILDYGIDSQIELDSNFTTGKYTLTFTVKDKYSNQTAVASTEFELTE